MEKYKHKNNETIRCSNLMYSLIAWFYNKGHYKTVPYTEGKLIDQRVFGPAAAKGLIAHDGITWFLTTDGVDWMNSFHSRSAWKTKPSINFSHYIQVMRSKSKVHVMKRKAG